MLYRLLAASLMTFVLAGTAKAENTSTPAATAGTYAAEALADVTISVASLNVRATPSTSARVLGSVRFGSRVTPLARSADGKWFQINHSGATGWIFAAYTRAAGPNTPAPSPTPPVSGNSVRVTSSSLNVRTGPGTQFPAIGSLKQNSIVAVTARSPGWLQINFDGRVGHIYANYTTPVASNNPAPTPAPTPPPTPAPPSAKPLPSKGFELGGHVFDSNYFGRMRDVGMGWAKVQVVFNDNAPDLSGLANAAHANNLRLLVGAVGNRARANDTNYHRAFASELAKLARQGVDAIEVWNEPNLDREYGGSNTGQVNPENYVNMLKESYNAIKAANAGAMVVSGAMAPTGYFGGNCTAQGCDDLPFLQRMNAAGAAQYMDCAGAHHNGTMVGPDTKSGAPVGSAFHHQWYFQGTLDAVHGAFAGKVPVCWTELGYVTGEGIGPLPSGFSWGGSITLADQTAWLSRAAELSRASGRVRFMIIWNIDARQFNDDPQAGFSIFRPNGSCPACDALKRVMGK